MIRAERTRHEWKHRAKVYKFGARWSWRCLSPGCTVGGSRRAWTQLHAFTAAFFHATIAGCWCCTIAAPAGITGYPLDIQDDEDEDGYLDRMIRLSERGIDAGKASGIS